MQNSSSFPHMHIRIQTHTFMCRYTHTEKNQTQAVSICMQSLHQIISQWPNQWSRQRESHLHLHACALVSVLPPYTHTHTRAHQLDAFSLSSWLSGVQNTHSLIPALSLSLRHMRRQVLYLIHYSIGWLLAAALTLPCWSLGKRLAEGN